MEYVSRVKCLNKISPVGTNRLTDEYTCGDNVENPNAILVRSAAMHDMELPESLLAIAEPALVPTTFPSTNAVSRAS